MAKFSFSAKDQSFDITSFFTEEEMSALYRLHDVVVAPHMGEAFGMTVLEAMACGRPVIATAWSGLCDFYNESAGWPINEYEFIENELPLPNHFPPMSGSRMVRPSVQALTKILERVASMQRSEISVKGANSYRLAQSYSWDKVISAFISEIRC